MRRVGLVVLTIAALAAPAAAGEALVVRTADGAYAPAAARQWQPAGEGRFRFVLTSGLDAQRVAAQLAERLAPIEVEATDAQTLVFAAPELTETALLEKLAGIEVPDEAAMDDALAALGDLGAAGDPTMGDVSSAGSIRAAKEVALPGAEARRDDPANLVGKVVGFEPCEPVPVLHIRVLRTPTAGAHQKAFSEGDEIAIRGYYAFVHGSREKVDRADPRTAINLKSSGIEIGQRVFGKPFQKDDDQWVLETIEVLESP
jgi:hypothetical protein